MATDLLIHATGLAALALNVLALVRTCETSLRVQSSLAGVLWTMNNLLLGAHTAAALSLLSASRTATSVATLRRSARWRVAGFIGFSALTLAIALFTWDGWPCLLLALASLVSTYAMFWLQGRALRTSMLLVSALWMYNAWAYGSWEQVAANAATAAAALYGVWRMEAAFVVRAATVGSRP